MNCCYARFAAITWLFERILFICALVVSFAAQARSEARGPQIGSLSNHDDDGNKHATNLHIWQWKTRFARAYFIFWHFEHVLVLSTTWNDLFFSCVDDMSISWQMFNFVLLSQKRWFQFNSRIVRTHFSSKMTLNNWKWLQKNLHFQMTFSLPSTSCLLKLPNDTTTAQVNNIPSKSHVIPLIKWYFLCNLEKIRACKFFKDPRLHSP